MTPVEIAFTVRGVCQPKGSTRAFALPVKGAFDHRGQQKYRAVTTSANPDLKSWETQVRTVCQTVMNTHTMIEGPVELSAKFYLLRPPSVPAKKRPWPTSKPDLDKLLRAVKDAMIGVVYRDDAQVVGFGDVNKYYDDAQQGARVEIVVREVVDLPPVLASAELF
jgi:Holliday junction resolvase RusA-like endonuclease